MVGPLAPPVALDHRQVEVPALDLGRPAVDRLDRGRREGHRGEARRARETLLGAAVAGVDPPAVDLDLDAAQRGDRVDQQERPRAVDQLRDLFQRLVGAGRGLGVDDPHHLGAGMRGEGVAHRRRVDGPAPLDLDRVHPGAAAPGDVEHPAAEDPGDADDHLVAGLDQVGDRGLHAGAAGPRDRQGQTVLGAEDPAQHAAGRVHDPQVLRVEVTDRRPRQGLQDPRRHVARPGPQQQPPRRIEGWRHPTLPLEWCCPTSA